MSEEIKTEPVYFHDCPALGSHTKVIKAYLSNKEHTMMLGWQYKCPFCSYTVGEFHSEIQPLH